MTNLTLPTANEAWGFYGTSGNEVFAIIIHQYLPHEAANPVSGLRAKISDLKAKYHI